MDQPLGLCPLKRRFLVLAHPRGWAQSVSLQITSAAHRTPNGEHLKVSLQRYEKQMRHSSPILL